MLTITEKEFDYQSVFYALRSHQPVLFKIPNSDKSRKYIMDVAEEVNRHVDGAGISTFGIAAPNECIVKVEKKENSVGEAIDYLLEHSVGSRWDLLAKASHVLETFRAHSANEEPRL